MYDIIGDIHGHADELRRLLEQLGYAKHGRGYRHADRKVVFVGDFIDKGPGIADAIAIARSTVDASDGFAVMGNHEYNAIAYHTKSGDGFFREHSEKNEDQHRATLKQLPTSELSEAITWFRDLPMSLELDGIRVVHAAWQSKDIEVIAEHRGRLGGVNAAFLKSSETRGSALHQAIENVLKGPELKLPPGKSFKDPYGHVRTSSRVRWYADASEMTLNEFCLGAGDGIFDDPVAKDDVERFECYPSFAPPVFFGHYWLTGVPSPLASNVACTDYSVARSGKLCAYRWNGESQLRSENFCCVNARS